MTKDKFVEIVAEALDVSRKRAIVLIRRAVAVHLHGSRTNDPILITVLAILRDEGHPKLEIR